jgi:hypothetical protein
MDGHFQISLPGRFTLAVVRDAALGVLVFMASPLRHLDAVHKARRQQNARLCGLQDFQTVLKVALGFRENARNALCGALRIV